MTPGQNMISATLLELKNLELIMFRLKPRVSLGRIMVPKDVHMSILGTYEYFTLLAKGN